MLLQAVNLIDNYSSNHIHSKNQDPINLQYGMPIYKHTAVQIDGVFMSIFHLISSFYLDIS